MGKFLHTTQEVIMTTLSDFEIFDALATGVLPYYQPIITLSEPKRVCYEMLGRLEVDDQVLAPEKFMPGLVRAGFMELYDYIMMSKAVRQMSLWSHRDHLDVHLHINASKEALLQPEYLVLISGLLEYLKVDPGLLTIEVVETCTFWKSSATLKTLAGLKKLGVNIAVDDFPCWESSQDLLNWLTTNPGIVQVLKIDRSLVSAVCGYDRSGNRINEDDVRSKAALLKSYLNFAEYLGLQVVAEGIENNEYRKTMKSFRIDQLQGFGIGRPQPLEKLYVEFPKNFERIYASVDRLAA